LDITITNNKIKNKYITDKISDLKKKKWEFQ
jgi:hypothetical protein